MSDGKRLNATTGDEEERRREYQEERQSEWSENPKEKIERRRSRRWMLINYKPSESKSSPFKSGAGAAESHSGSY